MHWSSARLANYIAAPIEFATTILCFHECPISTSTAQHVAPAGTRVLGALSPLRAHGSTLPVHLTKVGRTLRVDNVLRVGQTSTQIFGHEPFARVVGNHLDGLIELGLETIADVAQIG